MWGSLLSIGSSALSLLSSNRANKEATAGQAEANALSIAEAQKNRDFQERMTRNKHTYEVEDLRRAGLNPILSATAGAAVPSGSTANILSTKSHLPVQSIAKSQLLANIASTAQDIKLKKAMVETEKTKQNLNRGTVSIPGFYRGPATQNAINGAKSAFNFIQKLKYGVKPGQRS